MDRVLFRAGPGNGRTSRGDIDPSFPELSTQALGVAWDAYRDSSCEVCEYPRFPRASARASSCCADPAMTGQAETVEPGRKDDGRSVHPCGAETRAPDIAHSAGPTSAREVPVGRALSVTTRCPETSRR
jgi:hypothetical protein